MRRSDRNYQGTERPVVPVIVDIVVVDIRETTVVRVATVEPVRSVLENMLASIFYHQPLICQMTESRI